MLQLYIWCLQVQVRRSALGRETDITSQHDFSANGVNNFKPPVIRKGKLVVVDLAGSERIHKSGAPHNSTTCISYRYF